GALWVEPDLAADIQSVLRNRQNPYVWSPSGALSLIDPRFQSPDRWFTLSSANPPVELARLQKEILKNDVVYLDLPLEHPYSLLRNHDFNSATVGLKPAGNVGRFTVLIRNTSY